MFNKFFFILSLFVFQHFGLKAQFFNHQKIIWSKINSNIFYSIENEKTIWKNNIQTKSATISFEINPKDSISSIEDLALSADEEKMLLFCNAKRKWRYKTQGEYFIHTPSSNTMYKVGKTLKGLLSFAKFSPDGNMIAYVFNNNIYAEDLQSKLITLLTTTGSDKISNGTFDWSYEEEFNCRDGFRWSYDSKHIAFWNIDATALLYFTMLNNTDSVYPSLISFPYPKVNYAIPKVKIGIVDMTGKKYSWVNLSVPSDSHFIPRMDWFPNQKKIIFQYLNRQQNKSKLYTYNFNYKKTDLLLSEKDSAWIDTKSNIKHEDMKGWEWVDTSGSFLWLSEKNGFRQIYLVNTKGEDSLVTKANFDVTDLLHIDTVNKIFYFLASPNNSTQNYLYKKSYLDFNAAAQRLTPDKFIGRSKYNINPKAEYAIHSFTNYFTPEIKSIVETKEHKIIVEDKNIQQHLDSCNKTSLVKKIKFIQIPYPKYNTYLDAFIVFPDSFNANKKYPVLFYVYGEPASSVVLDVYKGQRSLYVGNKEFIYVGIDNRGAPQPKGRVWRKSIYGKIGIVNVEDQLFGAQEFMKNNFVDTARIGVWGWSGGGSLALNLILQHPQIYKTAVSIAPVTDLKLYDNIYEERYMNVLDSNLENYKKGSAISYAKNLQGKLLLIHGTGDDNVHFQNTEAIINEFIKYKKTFHLMIYPNRSHSINEGENTRQHLTQTVSSFLDDNLFNKP